MEIDNWNGRRVTVMGLGRFGGGVGVVRWLARQGARVTLTDQATAEKLAEPLALLHDLQGQTPHPIQLRLGGHHAADFAQAETLIVNPAVRPDNCWVREAVSQGVPITTEIGLFLDACPASVIGVTGSNGKSTTAAMTASILRADGRKTWFGGNFGGSLLGELASMTKHDWVVLELSSFQITYLPDQVRPLQIVVVTNCVPNHLDWHETFDDYAAAKRRLLQLQTPEGVAILPQSLAVLPEWRKAVRGELTSLYIEQVSPVACDRQNINRLQAIGLTEEFMKSLPVPGEHNRQNALAAATAAKAAGCADEAVERGLMTYLGLPDRLEPIGLCHGRPCINDTASTTPESTIAATTALPSSWLLVGGGDKGSDFVPMLETLSRTAQGVAFYGAVGQSLYGQFQKIALQQDPTSPAAELFTTLDEAFAWALSQSEPGETIILSPGCSSHDQFTHFVQRGEHFKRLVTDNGI